MSRSESTDASVKEWDYADVYDGPWRVDVEPRAGGQPAIKSGVFTVLTARAYRDGGGPIEERLQFICDAVNARLEAA